MHLDEHGLARAHHITYLHTHFLDLLQWQYDVRPRAQLDHADALAARHLIARRQPADDAPRHLARDLLHAHVVARLIDGVDPELLVAHGALEVAGVQEGAGKIANLRDSRRGRHAVDMHVEDRQEHA